MVESDASRVPERRSQLAFRWHIERRLGRTTPRAPGPKLRQGVKSWTAHALRRDPACEEARENLKKLCRLTGSTEQAAMERVGGEDAIHVTSNLYDISVIVPVHSRLDVLDECLRSLNGQTFPQGRFEGLLVVNGVTDEEMQDLQGRMEPWRRAFGERLQTPRIADASIAKARNEGIRVVRGLVVVQINENTLLNPEALALHWAEQERRVDVRISPLRPDASEGGGGPTGASAVSSPSSPQPISAAPASPRPATAVPRSIPRRDSRRPAVRVQ